MLSHVSKKGKEMRSTSKSDFQENVTPTHFGKQKCYLEPTNVHTELQKENITRQRPQSDNNPDVCRAEEGKGPYEGNL